MPYTLSHLQRLGHTLGSYVRGGECFELIGDVGAGKTTLTKSIAHGLLVDEDVQSPSFTISRTYPARDSLELHHYDFYRLDDPGIMRYELHESISDPQVITVIEWGESVSDILPEKRITIRLQHDQDDTRLMSIEIPEVFWYLQEAIS